MIILILLDERHSNKRFENPGIPIIPLPSKLTRATSSIWLTPFTTVPLPPSKVPIESIIVPSASLSKVFLIRYCEEEVEINDIVLFRAEIDAEPDYLNTDFYLEIELHFSNLDSIGGSE